MEGFIYITQNMVPVEDTICESQMSKDWKGIMRKMKELEVKTLALFAQIQSNNNTLKGIQSNIELF